MMKRDSWAYDLVLGIEQSYTDAAYKKGLALSRSEKL